MGLRAKHGETRFRFDREHDDQAEIWRLLAAYSEHVWTNPNESHIWAV